jgi:hypothetical protein
LFIFEKVFPADDPFFSDTNCILPIAHLLIETHMNRFLSTISLTTFLAVMAGCGGSPVTGKVTFDGTPVESGNILFAPTDGKSPQVSAAIKNGEYTAIVPSGTYKVSITAEKLMPSVSTAKGSPDEMRNYIPTKYSGGGTELSATVGGSNSPINFDLTGDASKKK